MRTAMIESHLAPESLAAARSRIDARAEAFAASGLVVVELGAGDPAREVAKLPAEPVCVVSEMQLWAWTDPQRRSLAEAIGPDGILLFLEPTADLAWRRGLHRLFRGPIRSRLGHDFEADVPAALREAGLLVGTTDRFPIGPVGLWSYVWGRAEHVSPAPASESG